MIFLEMSETSQPSLSQYFGINEPSSDKDQIDFCHELTEVSSKVTNLKIDDNQRNTTKNEPEVCRLFTETPQQPKDPTAAFFDLIGSSSHTSSNNGLMSDLGFTASADDGYTARVAVGSEADRRRDAWIPSDRTRQCLISCATAAAGTYFPDRELLTMPGVLLEEELNDTVGETVSMCLGEAEAAQRRVLTASDVTQDERGLRELVQAGAYRSAINLSARLLTIYGQGVGRAGHPSKHSPHSLQLWFTRIALLVKTKALNIAQAEAEPFGQLDKPDLFYQFYPEMYGGRPGSIASFSFRLILAELPMQCGKPKESLTRLFSVLSTVRQDRKSIDLTTSICSYISSKIWEAVAAREDVGGVLQRRTVEISCDQNLVNSYKIVRKILANLNKGLCEDGTPLEITEADRADSLRLWTGREVRVMHSVINCALALKDYELAMDILGQLCERDGAPKHALLSALGRLHLQLGDIAGAEVCFNESKEIRGGEADFRQLVDQGLLGVAQNAFDDAYMYFQQASMLEPNNVMILNNMGVCLLYGGRLKEAIGVLETAISQNPVHALHESLLLNLCTLYDMESSKGRMKKFALLRQISRYQADAPATILEKLYG